MAKLPINGKPARGGLNPLIALLFLFVVFIPVGILVAVAYYGGVVGFFLAEWVISSTGELIAALLNYGYEPH